MAKTRPEHAAKRLARLAAVQALYQIELTGQSVKEILKNFKNNPRDLLQEAGPELVADAQLPDFELMGQIVIGVAKDPATVDGFIAGALDARLSVDRLEILLKAILRCGAFELFNHGSVAAGIIVNDYVDITHAYFNAKEPGLVNAILDKLAKTLRS
jgi:N utilization substance protein B